MSPEKKEVFLFPPHTHAWTRDLRLFALDTRPNRKGLFEYVCLSYQEGGLAKSN